jgi:hypothetical protein
MDDDTGLSTREYRLTCAGTGDLTRFSKGAGSSSGDDSCEEKVVEGGLGCCGVMKSFVVVGGGCWVSGGGEAGFFPSTEGANPPTKFCGCCSS